MSDISKLLTNMATEVSESTSELDKTFKEEPVDLSTFTMDGKFMRGIRLSDVQYSAVMYSERVYYPEIYSLMEKEFGSYWKPIRSINFSTLQWGKGGGKDLISRIISMRVAYMLGCLHNPLIYYGLPDTDNIHLLNVAATARQAQRAFFKPITQIVKSGWFRGKCEPTQDTVVWKNNVEQVSGHSDADLQEGLNILVGVADEIDAFPTEQEARQHRGSSARLPTNSAEAILRMLRTSAASRFPEVFKVVRISYPRYKGSTIQSLTVDARKDNEEKGESSRHYVSGPLPTWKVNPRIKGKEAFAEDYAEDESMAKGMYECDPDWSISPFFRNSSAWELCERDATPIGVQYVWSEVRQAWEVEFDIPHDLKPIKGAQYAMHGDIGIRADRAGVAMAHIVDFKEIATVVTNFDGFEETRVEALPHFKVDFALWFEADLSAKPMPMEVQIRWYRQLMRTLQLRGFNVRRYTFDGFQSVDIMQQLEYEGIESERVSMDTTNLHWKNMRDLVLSGRVSIPKCELLKKEVLQLTQLPNGKIDHAPGGSKDVADSVCGALVGAVEVGGAEADGGREVILGEEADETPVSVPDTLPVDYPFDQSFSFATDKVGMGAGAWEISAIGA